MNTFNIFLVFAAIVVFLIIGGVLVIRRLASFKREREAETLKIYTALEPIKLEPIKLEPIKWEHFKLEDFKLEPIKLNLLQDENVYYPRSGSPSSSRADKAMISR